MGVRKQKNLIEKATEVADQVLPQVEAAFDHAVERAQEGVHQAAPLIAQGRVAAGQKITKGKVAAAPLVAQGKVAATGAIAHALDVAAHAAESTQHFAEEHAASLKEQQVQKKGGKLRKVLLFSGLLAVIGVVAKKLTDGREAAKWQSATSPTPPAPSSPPNRARVADDAAGADPAEALSDATDTPHAVTTPDAPASVVDVPAGPQEVAPRSAEAREDLEDIAAEDEADGGQGNAGRN